MNAARLARHFAGTRFTFPPARLYTVIKPRADRATFETPFFLASGVYLRIAFRDIQRMLELPKKVGHCTQSPRDDRRVPRARSHEEHHGEDAACDHQDGASVADNEEERKKPPRETLHKGSFIRGRARGDRPAVFAEPDAAARLGWQWRHSGDSR